MIVVERKRRL